MSPLWASIDFQSVGPRRPTFLGAGGELPVQLRVFAELYIFFETQEWEA